MEFIPTRSQYQNIANARLSGIELQTRYQTERLAVLLTTVVQKVKIKTAGKPCRTLLQAKSASGSIMPWCKTNSRWGKRNPLSSTTSCAENHGVTYQGYTLTDLHATYAPLKGEWKNLRLDVAVENLFDKNTNRHSA